MTDNNSAPRFQFASGDVNPFEHGGAVWNPETKEVIYTDGLTDGDGEEENVLVHRFDVNTKEYFDWADLESVASYCGFDCDDVEPSDLDWTLAIGAYYGFYNLDSYPVRWTEEEWDRFTS